MIKPKQLLLDSDNYGEDLLAIANRAFALAPQLCNGCASYHMRVPATRAVGMGASLEMDRSILVDRIREVLTTPQIANRETPTIAIIGSADTGLLATCAHAAAGLGDPYLARTKFMVADLCPTPLTLCAEFGKLHGLNVETFEMDFVSGTFESSVDVIFLHSILRFIPEGKRVLLLQKLSKKLRPGGKLVVSNKAPGDHESTSVKVSPWRKMALQKILSLVKIGGLTASQSLDDLEASLKVSFLETQNRDSAIKSLKGALELFERAGLDAEQAEINILKGNDERGEFTRHRLLAVLAPKIH